MTEIEKLQLDNAIEEANRLKKENEKQKEILLAIRRHITFSMDDRGDVMLISKVDGKKFPEHYKTVKAWLYGKEKMV